MADGEDRMGIASTSSSSSSSSSSSPLLLQNPNFKTNKGVTLTHHQLSKFQELHTRRLQIISKSKIKKNNKGATAKSLIKHHPNTTSDEEVVNEAAGFSNSDAAFGENSSHLHQHNTKTSLPSKKLQKLHWGLDTKEPWERKANM